MYRTTVFTALALLMGSGCGDGNSNTGGGGTGASGTGASGTGASGTGANGTGASATGTGGTATGGDGGTGGQAGSPANERRVFVTSETFDGALGGISGADAACQTLADAAALGGTWKAWVGDGTNAPSTTFQKSMVPYVLVSGVKVADDWAALTDGTLDAAIDHDENGTAIDPNGNTHVWTGASTTGDPLPYHCEGWTSAMAPFSPRGLCTATDSAWVMSGPDECVIENHLYCFEQ